MPILVHDPKLSAALQDRYCFVARKARTLGQVLSPSLIVDIPSKVSTWLNYKGSYVGIRNAFAVQ